MLRAAISILRQARAAGLVSSPQPIFNLCPQTKRSSRSLEFKTKGALAMCDYDSVFALDSIPPQWTIGMFHCSL